MPQWKSKDDGVPECKRKKKNLSRSEVEVLLQKLNRKQIVILSKKKEYNTNTNKKNTKRRCMGCYYAVSKGLNWSISG